MKIEDAMEARVQSSLLLSSFGDPREVVQLGPIQLMRDASGRKRNPRLDHFIICGVPPEDALREVKKYGSKHWALSVVSANDVDNEKLKEQYKAAGYRLLSRLPCFSYDLSHVPTNDSPIKVQRISMESQALAVRRASRQHQIPLQLLAEGDAPIRLYAHFEEEHVTGWVRSIRASDGVAWVSNLFVLASHRKKGIGSALMTAMLSDDAKFGAKHSVLMATNEGSKLYRRLGYEQIGLVQIFSPVKKKSL